MFDDKFFDNWLDSQAQKVMEQVANGQSISPEQMQVETAKRFEQVDKRFDQLTARMDHFMIGSFATTLTVGGIVIAAIKFL